jgi:hypothetical protein
VEGWLSVRLSSISSENRCPPFHKPTYPLVRHARIKNVSGQVYEEGAYSFPVRIPPHSALRIIILACQSVDL